jgi:hypothetical protein
MSSYFRHLKEVLDEAGVEITDRNKKEIDRVIHTLGGVEYKDCSLTWKKVKERIRQDPEARERFILNLKEALRGSISGT